METLVLWKRNVSIVAIPFVVAPIRNSVQTSAGIISITGKTAIPIISSETFMDFCVRTEGYWQISSRRERQPFIRMPYMLWDIISASLPI
jgi:hypothetical protein